MLKPTDRSSSITSLRTEVGRVARRGSADHHCGALPGAFLRPALRAMSTDLVREDVASHDVKTMIHLSDMMPAMPVGTNNSLSFTVGDYAVHHLLGKGGSGQVFMGSHIKTGEVVAIKMVDGKKHQVAQESGDLRDGISEFKILSGLNHKNIVKLLYAEENERKVCMVLEYAAYGDLMSHIRLQPTANSRPRSSSLSVSSPVKSATLGIPRAGSASPDLQHYSSPKRKRTGSALHCYSEPDAKRIFRQLLSAVHYLHLQGYIHRDIKPENVLINNDGDVLLCDFSLATTWNPMLTRSGSCGTLHFAAPEVLTDGKYVGPEVDIWSCGAVLYYMLSGEKPFQASDDFEVLRNIKKGRKRPLDKKCISRAARNLVDRMLEGNPLKRATMMDILNSEWFNPKYTPKVKTPKMFKKNSKASRSLDLLPIPGRSQSEETLIVTPCTTTSSSPNSPTTRSKKKKSKSKPPLRRSALFSIQE